MNKRVKRFCYVLVGIMVLFSLTGCKNQEKSIAKAHEKEERSVTVINKTESQYIKKCSLVTRSGIVVAHVEEQTGENIFIGSKKMNDAYADIDNFKIILEDKHGIKYEKEFTAKATGCTDVIVTESDLLEMGIKAKIERFLDKRK